MSKGDQVYVMREVAGVPGIYEHHGIDCGDGSIIHYRKTEDAIVTQTSLATFSRGNRVFIKQQPVSYLPDIVVQRAQSRLGEQRYDLLTNNCEHFATWCKTGQNRSDQLARFGLNLDRFRLAEVRQLIDQTAHDRSPEAAIALFQRALGDIATAHASLKTQYQQAQHDQDTWHRVAEAALKQGREDLARAALHRKGEAKQRRDRLTTQLSELVEIQLNLERSRQWAAQHNP